MSRGAIEREEKMFFGKTQNSKNRKSKNCKKAKRKTQKAKVFSANFELQNGSQKERRRNLFIHLAPPRGSGERVTEMPGSSGTLDVTCTSPDDASSFNEEIEPLIARRTVPLPRRSVVGSISNRGRNYEPARPLVLRQAELEVARRTPPYRGCMSVHGCD
jgi:hypothetical protein